MSRLKIQDILDGNYSIKESDFREAIVLLFNDIANRFKKPLFSIQCPLVIEVHKNRHPGWRNRTCKTCRWRSLVEFGEFNEGTKKKKCLLHPEINIFNKHPACPDYED